MLLSWTWCTYLYMCGLFIHLARSDILSILCKNHWWSSAISRWYSFIHSGYFYSTSLSLLLLRGAPYTERILFRSFTPKHHRQLRVKDLPKVPTWQLERDSNL